MDFWGKICYNMDIMSAEEVLRESESRALKNGEFVTHVTGRKVRNSKHKLASISATGFITLILIVAVAFFSVGNIVPNAISERLIEETDVQYADLVESKKIVLQQALREGNIPDDTAQMLKKNGVIVGYLDEGGNFVEKNKGSGSLVLKKGDEIISAENFISKINSDVELYNAVTLATYDRAAAYYDEAAYEVFREIGTRRNNFNNSEDLTKVMKQVMGEGSDIDINSVALMEKTETNDEGEEETTYEMTTSGETANSSGNAAEFVEAVRQKNPAENENNSALNAADTLKVADTISQEQRSSLFFALFMENISKMMAGDGNESKINGVLNFLHTTSETEVVDTKTGEMVKVKGSPMDSPSLYALLTGEKTDKQRVENYSSERILKTVRNRINQINGYSPADSTVASSSDKTKGSIGRIFDPNGTLATQEVMQTVEPTVNSSLMENAYGTFSGVNAGEFLAAGAVNLGKKLAKTSGATIGDEGAIKTYARLNNTVLAMDAKADRMNRSPFDVTSKNTFLGSIVYKFAMAGIKNKEAGNLISNVATFSGMVGQAVRGLLPQSFADDTETYLTSFGDCETIGTIGAVGTAVCSEIATFDTSTLNDPFNNPEFVEFVNNNTVLDENGTRTIKEDSVLADFIVYNDERKTPMGVMDGGILEALRGGWGSIPFISDILAMIEEFLGASEQEKRIASGEAFVNSNSNTDWQNYKYAQRYVSLARTTAMLKQHSNDQTAYRDLKFFEGEESPVVAFLNQYYAVADR